MAFVLANARLWTDGRLAASDVRVRGGRAAAPAPGPEPRIDLAGLVLLPGLVNGHDHLGFSTFPPLGRPPYESLYAWADDVRAGAGDARAAAALAVPLADRLLLGGLRNLLSGVTAVAHHDPPHRSLARRAFPVRVLRRYAHAHSLGLERDPARTRPRSARVPWMIHAAEGTDARARGEVAALAAAGLLRSNTVLVHAIGVSPEDVDAIAAAGAAVVWCPESNRFLYGATAPVATLRAAGVRLGLGSDSPLSGVRDALSNLAAARREATLDDTALMKLTTGETAAVFGLPAGGFAPGDPADFVGTDGIGGLLAGDRRAVRLVVVGGRALYGEAALLEALRVPSAPILVDGEERRLEAGLAARLRFLRSRHPRLEEVPWLAGVRVP